MYNDATVSEVIKAIAESSSFYDQTTCPAGSNAFLKAAKRGEFRTFRPGKKLLAKRADVDAWIEKHEATPGLVDDADTLLAAGGVSRASA